MKRYTRFLIIALSYIICVLPVDAKTIYTDTTPYLADASSVPVPVTENSSHTDTLLKTISGRHHFTYETVNMPLRDTMGLLGFSYLIDVTPYFSTGFGGYGSLIGSYGGFFTGGLENEVHFRIIDRLDYKIGAFFGAGGGAGTAGQGGGLMLRPHMGIIYDMGNYYIGAEYSWIKFPNGKIDSSQLALAVETPFEIIYSEDKGVEGRYITSQEISSLDTDKRKAGVTRQYLAVIGESYIPFPNIYKSRGSNLLQGSYDVVGFELGNYAGENSFYYIEAAGAAGGGSDGYAEILVGGGYLYPVFGSDKLYILAKGALGEGGGGFVPTGGGLIYKLYGGLEYIFSSDIALNLYGGYIGAPTGTFAGNSVGFNVGYKIDTATFDSYANKFDSVNDEFLLKGWRIRASTLAYFNGNIIAKTGASTIIHQNPIDLFCLKIDDMLDDNWYLTGNALGAYAGGDNAGIGGFAVGLVGVGYQSPVFLGRYRVFGEGLVGAAGGGGLSVAGGMIYQPMLGISYQLNNNTDLQLEGGIMKATGTAFQANIWEIGITYQFATLNK